MLSLKVILILIVRLVVSTPMDEFRSLVNEGEHDKFVKKILPSGYLQDTYDKSDFMPETANDRNEYFKEFNKFIKRGTTAKGHTFNVYDDNMRQAAITLFRYLQSIEENEIDKFSKWAFKNINRNMLIYALNLNYLYSPSMNRQKIFQTPCYIAKPNYFINSSTILKALSTWMALKLRDEITMESKTNYFYTSPSAIILDANYVGWNLEQNDGEEDINYFREDVGLNCYYLGIHLLHPFWMSNEELDELNERHAEHYYHSHQQLLARYNMESEHLRQQLKTSTTKVEETDYRPYLIYDNGLPFPVRPGFKNTWYDNLAQLKFIDLAIHELISRGFIVMNNGTIINVTSDNDINLFAKLIRANFDGIKIGKCIRSIFGYGSNHSSEDQYKPAPSILHHPETSLRDPLYWQMIKIVMNYFIEFKNTMEPFDLSQYETDEIVITNNSFSKIVTRFDYYHIPIDKDLSHNNNYFSERWPMFAKQRRLSHSPFTLNFTVQSAKSRDVVVRLFFGPPCNHCWNEYTRFYELDTFKYLLHNGSNMLSWSPNKSTRFSFEDDFKQKNDFFYNKHNKNKYNMFKFPENLIIPKGLDKGLNLKLFIMITTPDDLSLIDNIPESNYYRKVLHEIDTKPLGFPFHRMAKGYNESACNYKFYNIRIYHNRYFY